MSATTGFATRIDSFLAEFFRLHPLHATAAGMHAHDARWPDLTEAGRRERLAFADRWTTELTGVADAGLTRDERADRDLVLMELDALRFGETELRQEAWDPLEWVYLLGGGIFPLLAREFAPPAERLRSTAERLEGIEAVVAAARAELVGRPGRPVSACLVRRTHDGDAPGSLSGRAGLPGGSQPPGRHPAIPRRAFRPAPPLRANRGQRRQPRPDGRVAR